jgi:hypothetical protein
MEIQTSLRKEVNAFVVPSVSTNVALQGLFCSSKRITSVAPTNNSLIDMEIRTICSSSRQKNPPGSDISLSESAGRVLPDDREPGAQSENLRNGGVEHAILLLPNFADSSMPTTRM